MLRRNLCLLQHVVSALHQWINNNLYSMAFAFEETHQAVERKNMCTEYML